MADSVSAPLPAAEALRLAERARAAAGRPSRLPRWYGPTVAAGMVLFGAGVGVAIATGHAWFTGVLGGVWGLTSGAIGWAGVRSGGVMPKQAQPALIVPVLLAVLAVTAALLAGTGLAIWAGAGGAWAAQAGAVAGAVAFLLAGRGLNRRVERLRRAAG
ncbi:hypothetical protein ACFU7Y_25625 [Kitasatospora sp. NPDC057542]|uniref:hypothetical protein n=1 Tax=Kitasatospora sp. NPDC057542 TaxID=3346162 RepID=UPI0036955DD1